MPDDRICSARSTNIWLSLVHRERERERRSKQRFAHLADAPAAQDDDFVRRFVFDFPWRGYRLFVVRAFSSMDAQHRRRGY